MHKLLPFIFLLLCTDLIALTTEQKKTLAQKLIRTHGLKELNKLGKHISNVKEITLLDEKVTALLKKGKTHLSDLDAILTLSRAADIHFALWRDEYENLNHLKKANLYYKLLIDNNPAKNLDKNIFENAGYTLLALARTNDTNDTLNNYRTVASHFEQAFKKYEDDQTPQYLLECLGFVHSYIGKMTIDDNKEDGGAQAALEFAQASFFYEGAVAQVGIENASRELLQNAGDIYFQMSALCQGKQKLSALRNAAERYACAVQCVDDASPAALNTDGKFELFSEHPGFLVQAALSAYSYLFENGPTEKRVELAPYLINYTLNFLPLADDEELLAAYDYEIVTCAATAFLMLYDLNKQVDTLFKAKKLFDYLTREYEGELHPNQLKAVAMAYEKCAHLEEDKEQQLSLFKKAEEFYHRAIEAVKRDMEQNKNKLTQLAGPDLWNEAISNLVRLALLEPESKEKRLECAQEHCNFVLTAEPFCRAIAQKRKTVQHLLNPSQEEDDEYELETEKLRTAAVSHFTAFYQSEKKDTHHIKRAVASYEAFFARRNLDEVQTITLGNAGCAYFEYAMIWPKDMPHAFRRAITFFEQVEEDVGSLDKMDIEWLKTYARVNGMLAQHMKFFGSNQNTEQQKTYNSKAVNIYEAIFTKSPKDELLYNIYSDAATIYFFLWSLDENQMNHITRATELFETAINKIKKTYPHIITAKKEISQSAVSFIKHAEAKVPSNIFMNAAHTCFVLASHTKDNHEREIAAYLKTYQYFEMAFAGHELNTISPNMLIEYADAAYFLYLDTDEDKYADRAYDILMTLDQKKCRLPASSYKEMGMICYAKWKKGKDNILFLMQAAKAYDGAVEGYHTLTQGNHVTGQSLATSGLLENAAQIHVILSQYTQDPLALLEKALGYLDESLSFEPGDAEIQGLKLKILVMRQALRK